MDTLLLLCGRGFGKTWYVSNKAIDLALSESNSRIALWAADYGSLKKVNFLGESGIISQINPNLEYEFNKSDLILKFANGSQITGYSCEALERSRGSQSSHSVVDELAAWQYAEEGFEAELKAAIDSGASPEAFAFVQLKAAKDRGISLCAIKKESKAAAHAAPSDPTAKTEAKQSWAKVITKFGGK